MEHSETNYQEIGRKAFLNGEPCAPVLSEAVQRAIESLPVGAGSAKIMKAFIKGWTTANLSAA